MSSKLIVVMRGTAASGRLPPMKCRIRWRKAAAHQNPSVGLDSQKCSAFVQNMVQGNAGGTQIEIGGWGYGGVPLAGKVEGGGRGT